MADGHEARQCLDDVFAAEIVTHQAEGSMAVEAVAVGGDDARSLLAAMLERMQAEHGVRRGLVMSDDAENAAFLVQLVVIAGAQAPDGGHRRVRPRSLSFGACWYISLLWMFQVLALERLKGFATAGLAPSPTLR